MFQMTSAVCASPNFTPLPTRMPLAMAANASIEPSSRPSLRPDMFAPVGEVSQGWWRFHDRATSQGTRKADGRPIRPGSHRPTRSAWGNSPAGGGAGVRPACRCCGFGPSPHSPPQTRARTIPHQRTTAGHQTRSGRCHTRPIDHGEQPTAPCAHAVATPWICGKSTDISMPSRARQRQTLVLADTHGSRTVIFRAPQGGRPEQGTGAPASPPAATGVAGNAVALSPNRWRRHPAGDGNSARRATVLKRLRHPIRPPVE